MFGILPNYILVQVMDTIFINCDLEYVRLILSGTNIDIDSVVFASKTFIRPDRHMLPKGANECVMLLDTTKKIPPNKSKNIVLDNENLSLLYTKEDLNCAGSSDSTNHQIILPTNISRLLALIKNKDIDRNDLDMILDVTIRDHLLKSEQEILNFIKDKVNMLCSPPQQ